MSIFDDFDLDRPGDGGPRRDGREAPDPALIPSLPELIDQLNREIKWTDADLGRAMGYQDGSTISRWKSGERQMTPASIVKMVEAYREHYPDLTYGHIEAAIARTPDDDSIFGVPVHWVRLLRRVVAAGPEASDYYYRKWSADFQDTEIYRRRRWIDPDDDAD